MAHFCGTLNILRYRLRSNRSENALELRVRRSEDFWSISIEVHIVESGGAPGGLGEPATPPIAAAVTNALYILTGQRVRDLPIMNHEFSIGNPVAQV